MEEEISKITWWLEELCKTIKNHDETLKQLQEKDIKMHREYMESIRNYNENNM